MLAGKGCKIQRRMRDDRPRPVLLLGALPLVAGGSEAGDAASVARAAARAGERPHIVITVLSFI